MDFHDSMLQAIRNCLDRSSGNIVAELRVNLAQFTEHAELLVEDMENHGHYVDSSIAKSITTSMASFGFVYGAKIGLQKSNEMLSQAKTELLRTRNLIVRLENENLRNRHIIKKMQKRNFFYKNLLCVSFLLCVFAFLFVVCY